MLEEPCASLSLALNSHHGDVVKGAFTLMVLSDGVLNDLQHVGKGLSGPVKDAVQTIFREYAILRIGCFVNTVCASK